MQLLEKYDARLKISPGSCSRAKFNLDENMMAIMTPYSATTSQKMILLTLRRYQVFRANSGFLDCCTYNCRSGYVDPPINLYYQAAPTTLSPTAKLDPNNAHKYGFVFVRNNPTLNNSPLPVNNRFNPTMVTGINIDNR